MTTDFPGNGNEGDGDWFLEAVGASEAAPTGADAMADLTRENEAITPPTRENPGETDESSGEHLPDDATDDSPQTEAVDADNPSEAAPSSEDVPEDSDEVPTVQHTTTMRTTQITLSSFDGDPGTANATYAPTGSIPVPSTPAPQSPPPLPAAALAATATLAPPPPPSVEPPPPPAATPKPTPDPELSGPLRSSRSFRWPIIGVLVLLIVAVGAGAIWLPRATEAKAVTVRQEYYDATSAVRNHLPETQVALDVITTTDSSPDLLSATIPVIARLDSLALDMQRVASEPLPSVLPLIPKGAIDALVPLQQQTALLGTEGTELATRLGNAYIYRVTIPGLMNTGNLPSSASTETVNTISVTLAESLASDAAVISDLPSDPTFADVRDRAEDTHARYGLWQTEYLTALTAEDTQAAVFLLDELDLMRFNLNAANGGALGQSRTELDVRIVTYASELEANMSELIQG